MVVNNEMFWFLVAPPPKATTPRRNNMNGNQDLFGADPFQPITKPFSVSIHQVIKVNFLTFRYRKNYEKAGFKWVGLF